MTVSEYIFDYLQKKGTKKVFMVSGSSAMWLTDSLKRNENLEAVCCQHEQAAAMAADVTGRISGIPGVCLVTVGPGATNAVTGVAESYVDSSPMIVLSGQAGSRIMKYQMETGIRQKGTQSILLGNMLKDITKYFAVILDEKETRYHIERAFYEAVSGRKGPVWLDIPVDIQNKQVPENMEGFYPDEKEDKCRYSDLEDVYEKIKQMLRTSKKPLILAGNGVLLSNAQKEVLSFAEKYQIPVVTSRAGIGVISSDNPLFIGRPGSYGDRASHFAIQSCDALFIIGSRLSASTVGYYPDRFAQNAKKVMIDIDGKELEKDDVKVDIKVKSDIREFMLGLTQYLKDSESREGKMTYPSKDEWLKKCREDKEKYPNVRLEYKDEEGINSYYFTSVLSDEMSGDETIVVDTGSVCNVVSQSFYLKGTQKYIISGGLSCMGFWAGAIGAAAAGYNTVALSGDGSVQMNVQDFATLGYYKLPVKLFVYNNHGYLLIRHNQHNYMNDRFLGVGPDSGVPSVDFCKVAAAYGLQAVRIDNKDTMREDIKKVLKMEGPVICEVMVQEFGIIAPRIASRVMPDGSLKAAEFDDLWPFLT